MLGPLIAANIPSSDLQNLQNRDENHL